MTERTFLIERREELGLTLKDAAKYMGISTELLGMLEDNDRLITHPNIAARIAHKYKLTVEQYESMIHEDHRKGKIAKVKKMPEFIGYSRWYKTHGDIGRSDKNGKRSSKK